MTIKIPNHLPDYEGPSFPENDFILAVDSEFTNEKPVSLQVYVVTKDLDQLAYVVVNEKYREFIHTIDNINYPIFYSHFYPGEHVLLNSLLYMSKSYNLDHKLFKKPKLKIPLYFYFSLKDLNYAFGINNMLPFYYEKKGRSKSIISYRNIRGTLYFTYSDGESLVDFQFVLMDLKGLGPGGLKDLANANSLQKLDVLDEYKACMDKALIERPQDFLLYALNDCLILPTIHFRNIQSYNRIMLEKGIPEEAWFNEYTMPLTVGSIVNSIWEKNLLYNVFNNDIHILIALTKMSILNSQSGIIEEARQSLFEIAEEYPSLELLKQAPDEKKTYYQKVLLQKNVSIYTCYQYASVPYIISESGSIEAVPLGFTTGGRTVNERPRECFLNYTADVDIGGAYGSQLIQTVFPIGRPRILTFSSNEKQTQKLGAFMKKMLPKISSNLLKVSVSGKLSYEQDLIFSKPREKLKDYKINYEKYDPDDAAVNVPFVLLRKEIQNGFITPFLWEVLTKVCTNQELSEINNLTVNSAIYWLEADRVETIDDLANDYLADSGEYKFCSKLNAVVDSRSFKWFAYPIKNFIQPLMDKRAQGLKKSKNPMDRALDTTIKLIINTTWGLLTSPYFAMSNVCCSELVTSNIRTYIWLLSKSLNTCQSITDGGSYQLTNVSYLKSTKQKPGLEVLSSYYYYKDHPSITRGNLGDIDWVKCFNENVPPNAKPFTDLDSLVQQHIQSFWKFYGIDFNLKIEHKLENISILTVFFMKAHYWFIIYDFVTHSYTGNVYKIRGFRDEPDIINKHPIYLLMKYLKENPSYETKFVIPGGGFYQTKKLLKLNSWRRSLIKEKNQKVSSYGETVYPGDAIILPGSFRINNLHCQILDLDDYKKRERRSYRKIKINGYEVRTALFERYLEDCGIGETLLYMCNDQLIDSKKTYLHKYLKSIITNKPLTLQNIIDHDFDDQSSTDED